MGATPGALASADLASTSFGASRDVGRSNQPVVHIIQCPKCKRQVSGQCQYCRS